MKNMLLLFLLVNVLTSCKKEVKEEIAVQTETTTTSEDLAIYNFDQLEPLINKDDDKIHVVNFWATWCKPCVKELPYFEQVRADFDNDELEVLLISLDFPNQFDKKLKPFIKEHDLKSSVVALDDPDMNTWIPKVSDDWTGSIPATIIYNKDKRVFYERSFTQEELNEEIQNFLK